MNSITCQGKGVPQFGWIRGQFPAGGANLNFDRRQNTVKGDIYGDKVSISTNPDAGQIKGSANKNTVDLHQDWSPQLVKLDGWANGSRYNMTIDYDRKQASGSAGERNINLNFDLQDGFIRGWDGKHNVDLTLSKDGLLEGAFAGGQVSAEMINLDLGHLMSHWYLISK